MWPRAAYWWTERSKQRIAPAPLPSAWLCWSLRAISVDCSCPGGSVDCGQHAARPLGRCSSRSLPAHWAARWRRTHSTYGTTYYTYTGTDVFFALLPVLILWRRSQSTWGTDVCFAFFVTSTKLKKTDTHYLRVRRVLCILCYLNWAYENGHTVPERQTCSLHSLLRALSLRKRTHSTWVTDVFFEFFITCTELIKTDTYYLRDVRVLCIIHNCLEICVH